MRLRDWCRKRQKPCILVIAGGQSPEHVVSISSAANLLENVQSKKLNLQLAVVTRQGKWLSPSDSIAALRQGYADHGGKSATACSCLGKKGVVAFPLIHGATGEDGTLQGFLQMLQIPFLGCGVPSSAMCMNKALTKMIFGANKLPQVAYTVLEVTRWREESRKVLQDVAEGLSFPMIVKPSGLGSSIGVSKATCESELSRAVEKAFEYGSTVIIEEFVENMFELEIGIIGHIDLRASAVSKVKHPSGFMTYKDKYNDQRSYNEIPARITPDLAEQCRSLALRAYRALGCDGMARVDMIYHERDSRLLLNEVNTVPGFTASSAFAEMWKLVGLDLEELLSELVQIALSRSG